ncbi:DNA alkylation repair protein [Acetivibrio ethanolgignens]|uniref:DNA alkylation repair protein n=1 Tax=Acetivibrio ethanolgignens TaxID=290052 RepID=A0A0V8QDF8_9FIRM|nr:DNA alkylation repair protein [Acetivibrio ethanolgignens]KSV58619.1 DNA alkylation repair protein [Acetivibrio ethanolgignens]
MEFTKEATRKRLRKLSDEKYREFHSGLVPGKDNILGVRIPKLRAFAKEICREDWRLWLSLNKEALEASEVLYEEILLQGLVIAGGRDASFEELLKNIREFVPYIDNWAVCDTFCASLKQTKKHKKEMWEFLQPYLESDKEYFIRFGVVMLLDYYVDREYLEKLYAVFDSIHHEGYYVKMAVAWALSVCYVKFPKETMRYLKNNKALDDFTYNKAIQKTCESYRVEPEEKERLKTMKRKSVG